MQVSRCRVVISARPRAVTNMPITAIIRDPRRSAQIPASGEEISIPTASGASLIPARIGELP